MLGACGGGGAGGGGEPTSQPQTADPGARAQALAAYQATRSAPAPAGSADLANAAAASQRLAVTELLSTATDAAVPALSLAPWQLLAAATSGDSASELRGHSPAEALDASGAAITSALQREIWLQSGYKLLPEFWVATEKLAGAATVAAWSATEVDLAKSGLAAPTAAFDPNFALRLVLRDRLQLQMDWPAATWEDGLFTDDDGLRRKTRMLRLKAGVRSYAQDDHRAEALTVGRLTLLALRPTREGLAAFGPRRLASALKESADALIFNTAAALPVAGEMLLPEIAVTEARPLVDLATRLRAAGLSAALDPLKANLKAMDGTGGNFAQAVTAEREFRIAADGLKFNAAALLGFAFNPNNPNGNGSYGVGITTTSGTPTSCFTTGSSSPCCPSNGPALRSFYLAIFDEQKLLQGLVAVRRAGDFGC